MRARQSTLGGGGVASGSEVGDAGKLHGDEDQLDGDGEDRIRGRQREGGPGGTRAGASHGRC